MDAAQPHMYRCLHCTQPCHAAVYTDDLHPLHPGLLLPGSLYAISTRYLPPAHALPCLCVLRTRGRASSVHWWAAGGGVGRDALPLHDWLPLYLSRLPAAREGKHVNYKQTYTYRLHTYMPFSAWLPTFLHTPPSFATLVLALGLPVPAASSPFCIRATHTLPHYRTSTDVYSGWCYWRRAWHIYGRRRKRRRRWRGGIS